MILDYSNRERTLEEVVKLLKSSLSIKLLRGGNYLWQAKLEQVRLCNNPNKYIFVRTRDPNESLTDLCKMLSKSMILDKNGRTIRLGVVKKGLLYLRYHGE